jgi:predicted nicotinamide N-methyase
MAAGMMGTNTVKPTDRIASFIIGDTRLRPVPFVPEIVMRTAAEAIPLWERTEQATGAANLAPPFWAFPWAGGQALARYVIDHPTLVRDRSVLDLASGGGLVAIAAAKAGAARVLANEIDPYADAAIALNAAANGVTVERIFGDLLDEETDADLVLAGDVFYSRAMATAMLGFMRRAIAGGAEVLVGDPGRAYAPTGLVPLALYDVPVIRDLEDADTKAARVLRIAATTALS